MKHKSTNLLLLMLTAFIWGSSFIAQSVGMDYLGPFTFNAVRSLLGGIVLLPVVIVSGRKRGALVPGGRKGMKDLLAGGLCCGLVFAVSSSFQQIGLIYTPAGKTGFITALYILIVPLLGLFLGRKVGLNVWFGVALAVPGLYLLCVKNGFALAGGDILVLICAVGFSIHILLIDYFAPRVDGVSLSCVQFFVSSILCGIPMLLHEHPQMSEILASWQSLLYAGCLSCGVAYTLQIVAQKNTDPTVASLILSLESVFGVITGWLILGERLSGREMAGCLLVFGAVILAQLPVHGNSDRKVISETD